MYFNIKNILKSNYNHFSKLLYRVFERVKCAGFKIYQLYSWRCRFLFIYTAFDLMKEVDIIEWKK